MSDRRIDVRKVGAFLCGITAAIFMTGCGSVMPDLTEEETEIISEIGRASCRERV